MLGSAKPKVREWNPASIADERKLLERIAERVNEAGGKVLPYRDPDLPRLKASPRFEESVLYLGAYLAALDDCVRDAVSPRDTPQFLWRFVRRLGWQPQPDIFGRITSENVVEIYTIGNIQVFRNLRFFDFCSYTIEELAYMDWTKFTRRSGKMRWKLLGIVLLAKTGRLRKTADLRDTGEDLVEELLGEGRRFRLRLEFLSPLLKEGRTEAILATNLCRFAI